MCCTSDTDPNSPWIKEDEYKQHTVKTKNIYVLQERTVTDDMEIKYQKNFKVVDFSYLCLIFYLFDYLKSFPLILTIT